MPLVRRSRLRKHGTVLETVSLANPETLVGQDQEPEGQLMRHMFSAHLAYLSILRPSV